MLPTDELPRTLFVWLFVCQVLSTQSLLLAVGVGASTALPAAAALNWVIKDGFGQLGGVIFASSMGNRFDADPKRWRMLAGTNNAAYGLEVCMSGVFFLPCGLLTSSVTTTAYSVDFAILIEILTPLVPGLFLLLASLANVGESSLDHK